MNREVQTFTECSIRIAAMQTRSSVEHKLGIPQLNPKQMTLEIAERIRCARMWCQNHRELLRDHNLHYQVKFQLYKFFVRPILTYGCEVWSLDDRSSKKLLRFECATLLEIYKSKYPHRHPKRLRPNIGAVYRCYRNTDVVDHVVNERLTWSQLLNVEEKAFGRRKRGRKRVRWWDRPFMVADDTPNKGPSTAVDSLALSVLSPVIIKSRSETHVAHPDKPTEAPG